MIRKYGKRCFAILVMTLAVGMAWGETSMAAFWISLSEDDRIVFFMGVVSGLNVSRVPVSDESAQDIDRFNNYLFGGPDSQSTRKLLEAWITYFYGIPENKDKPLAVALSWAVKQKLQMSP